MPIYWRPLYSFLRRQGCGAEDARDLIQGFFADLIETRAYARADREKGGFRSFLLGTLKHFAADVHDRERALKRDGGLIFTNLDDQATAEAEAQIARATKWQPEEVYDRSSRPVVGAKDSEIFLPHRLKLSEATGK